MKKYFLIIFVFLFLLVLPVSVFAEENKEYVIDFSNIRYGIDLTFSQERIIDYLVENEIITMEYDDDSDSYMVKDKLGNLLFGENSAGFFFAPGKEEYKYIFSDEDKEAFKNIRNTLYYFNGYDSIIFKFPPSGMADTKSDYIITIKGGNNVFDIPRNALVLAFDEFVEKGVLKTEEKIIMHNMNGKKLIDIIIDESEENLAHNIIIPSNVTNEDDIIYEVTDFDREKSINEHGRDVYGDYNKIILKFSNYNYSNSEHTVVIDMKNLNNLDDVREIILDECITNFQNKLIKSEMYVDFYNSSNKKLFSVDMSAELIEEENIPLEDMKDFLSFIVPYDVGENDTIYYDITDELHSNYDIPDGYKRIVVKFIPGEQKIVEKNTQVALNGKLSFEDIISEFSTSAEGWFFSEEGYAKIENGKIIGLKAGRVDLIKIEDGITYRIHLEITPEYVVNLDKIKNPKTGDKVLIIILLMTIGAGIYFYKKK